MEISIKHRGTTKMILYTLYYGMLVRNIDLFFVKAQNQQSSLDTLSPSTMLQPNLSRQGCSGTQNSTSRVITSPGYPNNYASSTNCEWRIVVGLSKVILIQFDDFDVENDNECGYDKLTVQEQIGTKFKTTAKLCGSQIPSPLRTRSNTIRILFTSDESENRKGFKLKWNSVANEIDCGATDFNSTSGSIQSPGFPNSYENSINCTYNINVERGSYIVISIAEVDIEYGRDCKYDSLLIQEIKNSQNAVLGKFCGTKQPLSDVISTGNQVLLTFTSDESTNGKGFNITWISHRHIIETDEYKNNEALSGRRQCGRKYYYSTRIVGGTVASKGEFPWQAGLFWRAGVAKGKYFCGGALVGKHWVVTAAHCFVNGRNTTLYQVKLGDQNLLEDDGNEQVFNISAIIIHHRYNPVTYDNDVALVRLGKAANLTEFVNTLCLPSIVPWPAMRCMVAGWGATMEHGQASNNLLKAEVPIVDRSTCARADVYGSKLTRNMICAGYSHGGIDTCQGDSGGPLHCQNKDNPNIWEVQGIASWGRGCGRQLRYGVYTKVHNFITWIECITKNSERLLAIQRESHEGIVCKENATDVHETRSHTAQVDTTLHDHGFLHSGANSWVSVTASKEHRYQNAAKSLTFPSSSQRSTDKTSEIISESLNLFINITSATSTNTSYIRHSKNLRANQSWINISIDTIIKQTEMLPGRETGLVSPYATPAEQTKVVESELPRSIAVLSYIEPFTTIIRAAMRSIKSYPPTTEEPRRTDILPTASWIETTLESTITTPHAPSSSLEKSLLVPHSGEPEKSGEAGCLASGSLMPESMITTSIQKTSWQTSEVGLPLNATNFTSTDMQSAVISSWYDNSKTRVPNTKSNGSILSAQPALYPIAIAFLCIRYVH